MAFCEEGNERRVESELDSNERERREKEGTNGLVELLDLSIEFVGGGG